jgi:hypothetical protein
VQQPLPDVRRAAVRGQIQIRVLQQPLHTPNVSLDMRQAAGGCATCICVTLPSKSGRWEGGDRNHSFSPCSTCAACDAMLLASMIVALYWPNFPPQTPRRACETRRR